MFYVYKSKGSDIWVHYVLNGEQTGNIKTTSMQMRCTYVSIRNNSKIILLHMSSVSFSTVFRSKYEQPVFFR